MSIFSALNTGITGLAAAQRAMNVSGQNVVNANTPGYSRQQVQLASAGSSSSGLFSGRAQFGGVTVADVQRVRNAFLEATRATAGGQSASLSAQVTTMTGAQQLLAEPGETGLQNTLAAFFTAWHDLSNKPEDGAAAAVVLQPGAAVTGQLSSLAADLSNRWQTAHADLATVVSRTNQAAGDLASLNRRIQAQTYSGQPVNDLLDLRDTLVRSLSELVGATSIPGADNQVSVSINGISLVSGGEAQQIALGGGTQISEAATNPPYLVWGNTPIPVASGSAAGLLAGLTTELPQLSDQFDQVAVALRDSVNAVLANGYTLTGQPSIGFFDGTTAASLTVIPTSGSELPISASATAHDGSVASTVGDLLQDSKASAALGGGKGASELWRDVVTTLGVKVQSLKNASSVQTSVLAAADSAVEADSGVNLDEEMTNMMQFQRAYQASARVISTIDSMLDTLINGTGGR